MRASSFGRYAAAGLALGAVAVLAWGAAAPAESQSNFVQDGRAGFVVTFFDRAASSHDASETGACPNGLSRSYREIIAASAEGERRENETELEQTRRIQQRAREIALLPDGQMICMNPEAAPPDQFWQMAAGRNVPVYGIDLDGQDSRIGGRVAANTCAHDDFRGVKGEHGVDNQYFRAVGCVRGYQPSANTNGITLEMLQGSWGLLFTLSGVDDLRNDPDVEVGLYSNADPIQVTASTGPLANVTYASVQDPRFRATTHGRIVNGVLSTDPVDFRFRYVLANLRMERVLKRARIQASIGADGAMDGILAGYAPIEELYDTDFGFRRAVDANGQITPYRLQIARGAPDNSGFTCEGAYRALYAAADGDPDPVTGRCTSISSQYRIRAVPAFVVNTETRGANAELEETSSLQQATGENNGAPRSGQRQ